MVNIITSDLLIADIITPLDGNKALQGLVDKYALKPGGKSALTKEQFQEFSRVIEGHPITIRAGGSTANTLTTLARTLDDVHVDFIGATGESMYSQMIRNALSDARINLVPENISGGKRPETAVSYVILYPDGQRTIATYPGNAKDIVKRDMITDAMIAKSDVVMIQGSLWQKFDREYADELMKLRWEHDKELWLPLPTHAKFGKENADNFQWMITSANLILGNDEELASIYKTDFGQQPDAAIYALQKTFMENDPLHREGKYQRRPQVAFITRGEKGAAIVTKDAVSFIPSVAMPPGEIVNTLGAGDTAFAGFVAGHLRGLSNEHAAKLAMVLAAEKLKENGPRLADPKASLKRGSVFLAQELFAPAANTLTRR